MRNEWFGRSRNWRSPTCSKSRTTDMSGTSSAPGGRAKRAEAIFEEAASVHSNSGWLWGDRLLSPGGASTAGGGGPRSRHLRGHRNRPHPQNKPGIHALTAWRAYNAGAVLEQRIEELKELSVDQTAVVDLAGNRLLWTLGGLAYQLLYLLRSRLSGAWRRAQTKRLWAWLFRTPAKLTRHARQQRGHLTGEELSGDLLPRALAALRGPPT